MCRKFNFRFAILLCTQVAIAEESSWNGEGELGLTHTSGNTTNENSIAKLKVGYSRHLWEHKANLEVLRASDDDKLTAERYELRLQSNYKWSEKGYVFCRFRYEDDSFGGYDYQTSLSTGYGHEVFKMDMTSLKLEAGIGIRRYDARRYELETDEESGYEPIGIFGLNYTRKIGSHTEFTQDFFVEAGSENIYSESNSGLKVSITEKVALKFSVLIKSNSDVPSNKEKTDTVSAVTLVYSF